MPCACIDIGSNTTRLLVAEHRGGELHELASERAFTRIGTSIDAEGTIPAAKVEETARVVAAQASQARALGADRIEAVATAAIRRAGNRDELVDAIEQRAELALQVLSEKDEARLSFAGATRSLAVPGGDPVAVADVGGGSTEVAVGTAAAGVEWWASAPIGSGLVCDGYLRSDPPAAAEIERARRHALAAFEGLTPPPVAHAVAVGGSATSLRRLVGGDLRPEAMERSLHLLATTPVAEVAARFELDPERVRLLPGGILIFEALAGRLGRPLEIAAGGLREGVILEALGKGT